MGFSGTLRSNLASVCQLVTQTFEKKNIYFLVWEEDPTRVGTSFKALIRGVIHAHPSPWPVKSNVGHFKHLRGPCFCLPAGREGVRAPAAVAPVSSHGQRTTKLGTDTVVTPCKQRANFGAHSPPG